MTDNLLDSLEKRKNRVIANILRVKDDQCDQHLPAEASDALRRAILDGVNDLADLAKFMLKNLPESMDFNQVVLDRFDQLHNELVALRNGH